MDWVKPKQRARQRKQQTAAQCEITAEMWLKQLCDENVALLQASLPIDGREQKLSKHRQTVESYVDALAWGAGAWETASDEGLSKLHDFVHAFGARYPRRQRGQSKAVNESLNPTQIATAKSVGTWISKQLPKASFDPYVALVSAGWIHALPNVGRDIPPSMWIDVLQSIMTQVDRAWSESSEDGVFPWLIWSCEIPLALAKQLSHLGGKDRIVSDSLNRIAELLEESADSPAQVLHRGGLDLRAIIGSLVRSRWAANEVGARKWYPPQRKALSKLILHAVSLADANGLQLLFDEADSKFDSDFWLSAYELAEQTKKLTTTMCCALPDQVGKALGEKPSKLRKESANDAIMWKPSHYCDQSSIVTMRKTWREKGNRAAVDFSSDVIWLDLLGADGSRIFSGDWDLSVEKDGKELTIENAWEEVCWFSDDDVDYLELECSIDDVCKVQRQIMLMRNEGMFFTADALMASSNANWKLRSTFDLVNGLALKQDQDTTECKLVRERGEDEQDPVALMLPVSLPEWKRSKSNGSIRQVGDKLEITSQIVGSRIYSPMVFALNKLRKPMAYTWRQLTVAEDLRIQPREVAEAYRLQINQEHWVFYRSLTPCTRRTVMGLHLNNEFYAGRFSPSDGQFEAMIEVSQDES